MKYLFLLFSLFVFSLVLNAQSSNASISNGEKKELESRFKALGNFYINERGLVVYSQSENTSTEQTKTNIGITESETEVKLVEEPSKVITIEESIKVEEIVKVDDAQVEEIVKIDVVSNPIKQTEVKEEAKIAVAASVKKDPESKKKDVAVTSQKEEAVTITTSKANETKRKSPNRFKETNIKSIDEARYIIDDLIEKYKKEEKALKSTGSMSDRLSKGADLRDKKGVGKNNAVVDPYGSPTSANNSVTQTTQEKNNYEEDGPSYFINGVQVDKTEINKLTDSEIIKREIRVNNTVTNNPNGEIWYTVKQKALQE